MPHLLCVCSRHDRAFQVRARRPTTARERGFIRKKNTVKQAKASPQAVANLATRINPIRSALSVQIDSSVE